MCEYGYLWHSEEGIGSYGPEIIYGQFWATGCVDSENFDKNSLYLQQLSYFFSHTNIPGKRIDINLLNLNFKAHILETWPKGSYA